MRLLDVQAHESSSMQSGVLFQAQRVRRKGAASSDRGGTTNARRSSAGCAAGA
jgi:hypothetical protein